MPKKMSAAGNTQQPGLTKWDERMAALAKQSVAQEKGVIGGATIQTANGVLKFQGAEIPGNKMDVIVLDGILANLFYEDGFDSDKPVPPVCFAYGRGADDEEMAPHEDSAKPQAKTCAECKHNEWGSADRGRGRGKACGNKRRLALITKSSLENPAKADIAYIHVPVTSVKAWAGYVRSLNDTLGKPPLAVITRIALEKDSKTQFKMTFELVEEIEASGDTFAALWQKHETAQKEITWPYVQIAEAEPPTKKGPARKTKF